MSTDSKPAKALTPAQRGAAALEAGGATNDEIARALDVSVATIKSWRKEPLYSVALDEIGRRSISELKPIVSAVRNELAQGLLEAVKTLVENLQATDDEGHPHYSSRQAAAATLMSHADLILEKPGARREGEQSGPAAQAVVQVTISEDAIKDGSPFHVLEGTADEEPADPAPE